MEVFKTIEGFEDYKISNQGKVMSCKWGRDRLMKPGKDAGGYLHVRLYDGDETRGRYANGDIKPKLEKVHRLVLKHFGPEPDTTTYQEVNHKDGDKENNDVTNLEWVSRRDNILHGWKTGLMEEGRISGGIKRRKPVMITYKDGRVEYYQSRTHCAIDTNSSGATIILKLNSGEYGRKGFKVEELEELPKGAVFTTSEDLQSKVEAYAYKWRTYLTDYRQKKRENKLVEEK